MKKSFTIMAVAMAMAMMATVAMAGTVDIGLGSMDRTEFETLRQMVSGDFEASSRVSAEKPSQRQVAEFNEADVEEIRLAMTKTNTEPTATAFASGDKMVDIGTGSMATGEFCDLSKLVASNSNNQNSGFAFICP